MDKTKEKKHTELNILLNDKLMQYTEQVRQLQGIKQQVILIISDCIHKAETYQDVLESYDIDYNYTVEQITNIDDIEQLRRIMMEYNKHIKNMINLVTDNNIKFNYYYSGANFYLKHNKEN